MNKLTDKSRKLTILITWILVGFIVISQLLFQLPLVQIIALGLVIAIQYKAKSLSNFTLGLISVVYVAILIIWVLGT
jgi:hypothetical protein